VRSSALAINERRQRSSTDGAAAAPCWHAAARLKCVSQAVLIAGELSVGVKVAPRGNDAAMNT